MPIEQQENAGPEIAVLIVSYNSAGDLIRCLTSVISALRSIRHEICIIDNGSKDNSTAVITQEFPSARLISNPENRGFAAAMNQGLHTTQAPYLLWLNPDAEFTGGNLVTVLDYLKTNPKAGILGIKILNPDGSLQLSARSFPSYSTALFNRYSLLSRLFPKNPFTRKYLGTNWDHNEIHAVDWVSGAALLHRRSLLQQIGYLDETFFMYCEDVDFCLRATRAGWGVFYHPGLTVRHAIGGSSKSARLRMVAERHRSIWHYYKKHFKRNPLKDWVTGFSILLRFFFLTLLAGIKKALL